jgi:hypothetical protein
VDKYTSIAGIYQGVNDGIMRVCTGFFGSAQEPVAGSGEHGYEPSRSMGGGTS